MLTFRIYARIKTLKFLKDYCRQSSKLCVHPTFWNSTLLTKEFHTHAKSMTTTCIPAVLLTLYRCSLWILPRKHSMHSTQVGSTAQSLKTPTKEKQQKGSVKLKSLLLITLFTTGNFQISPMNHPTKVQIILKEGRKEGRNKWRIKSSVLIKEEALQYCLSSMYIWAI